MRYRILVVLGLLAGLVSGCAQKGGATASAHHDPSSFESVKEPPINANTHFAAGQLAESHENYAVAIAQYKDALAEQPSLDIAMFRLGYVYAETKQYPQAIETWKRYVKATNGSAAAYSNLAFCEELAGNPGAAETDYQKGITVDPKNQACRVNYGLMLARHNRMNEAMIQLQSVLSPAEVHYNLAGVYATQGRKALAKAEYQKAFELDPNLLDAKTRLAQLN